MSEQRKRAEPGRTRSEGRRARRVPVALVATVATVTAWVMVHPQASGSAQPRAASLRIATQPVSPVSAAEQTAPAGPPGRASRPTYTPCSGNRRAQLVVVSIRRQHVWACSGGRTLLSTAVTTGATSHAGDATPRGTFAVQGLNRNTTLDTSTTGSYPVRFWVPFHLGVWGFHDASWQTIPYGSPRYVTQGSHGCVHVPLRAMRWLFHWLRYGTPVRIT